MAAWLPDRCVRCGHPVDTAVGGILVHIIPSRSGGYPKFVKACPDGSGAVACLAQGGVE